MMKPQDVIRRKRDGEELSIDEIEFFISGVCSGSWSEAQIAALTMAIFIHGLSDKERDALVKAIVYSGEVLDFSDLDKPKADKHSTGGVGDKTSLIVAPLVASFGVAVPMISGRSLGHTGGTLDKLESISGYNVNLSISEIKRIINHCGFVFAGQSESLVPADKKLYALRDSTATIECLPLIVASIMSKKLAERLDALVLDVKTGNGAFMKSFDEACKLAEAMVQTGKNFGVKTEALITDMNQPLGKFVGNSLEVYECIRIMRDEADEKMKRTVDLSVELAARMLLAVGKFKNLTNALLECRKAIKEGAVLEKFRENVTLQDGDLRIFDHPESLLEKMLKFPVKAEKAGFVAEIDTRQIGEAVALMGAGRVRPEDKIDHGIGLECLKEVGDEIKQGEDICILYCRSESQASRFSRKILDAYKIKEEPVARLHLIHGFVS
ncbi:MAG: thymidine phosphorylase [Pyrinomonadaceae bacterium]|nr:thymidine phosphorylase [Pyrinomonadaceae bacterium]MCX7639873.1 thymidine phosphorylase [Pyrinomonadaceae bacterium]MDW8304045.1 thymidine phosphorylase [Acidobacteriota bacterium]